MNVEDRGRLPWWRISTTDSTSASARMLNQIRLGVALSKELIGLPIGTGSFN